VGFVGPGVQNLPDQTIWTDHTDMRPTINSIVGLRDDYPSDGRVNTYILQPSAYSSALAGNLSTVQSLADNYKQITAPFGQFGQCIINISTVALQGNDPGDMTYSSLESQIASLTSRQQTLIQASAPALDGCEFGGTPINTTQANTWIAQAQQLISDCNAVLAPAGDAGGGG
jgi:hypothetical protein